MLQPICESDPANGFDLYSNKFTDGVAHLQMGLTYIVINSQMGLPISKWVGFTDMARNIPTHSRN